MREGKVVFIVGMTALAGCAASRFEPEGIPWVYVLPAEVESTEQEAAEPEIQCPDAGPTLWNTLDARTQVSGEVAFPLAFAAIIYGDGGTDLSHASLVFSPTDLSLDCASGTGRIGLPIDQRGGVMIDLRTADGSPLGSTTYEVPTRGQHWAAYATELTDLAGERVGLLTFSVSGLVTLGHATAEGAVGQFELSVEGGRYSSRSSDGGTSNFTFRGGTLNGGFAAFACPAVEVGFGRPRSPDCP